MRAESGETEARARFEGLFSGHYGELLRFAQRRVGIDAAGDVVAETFLIAWRRLPEVPAEHARAWLYMTARHVIANELRARQRRDRLSGHTRDDIATDRAVAGDHATVIAEQIRVRSVFTIHPDAIPSGDQLLVIPRWLLRSGHPPCATNAGGPGAGHRSGSRRGGS